MLKSFQNLTKIFIYPCGKVHKNYGKYVGWSCISNVVISIESVLSTHTMLSVVGQTNSDITLSINYIGKDIVGQLGGLWYMHKIGQKVDKESSKFINYSIFFQQSAVIMECATPLLPIGMFIPIAGIANVGKNIAATGMGAVNARVIQKLAEDNNIGEIYAKISILNTLGSTIGMAIGLLIAARVPDHSMRLGLMPFFTVFRIYSYNKAVDELI
jgi:glutamate N-acetyltransferase/amino-acid N-acetyltransferase